MRTRMFAVIGLIWSVVAVMSVVWPLSAWMLAMLLMALALLLGLAVAAAQSRPTAVFARGMLLAVLIVFGLMQMETWLTVPVMRLSRRLLDYSQLKNLGPGAERTLANIWGRMHSLVTINVALVIGALTGWIAVLVDRRSETVEPSTSRQPS